MPSRIPKNNLERLRERTQQGSQLAAATVNLYAGKEPQPADDASPDAWASWVNAARGRAAEAVIEWGRRVAAAHQAYSSQPQRWGRTWEDWCQQNLGIGKGFANKLQMIGQNLALSKSQIYPAATDQLYDLARLNRDNPQAFDAAVAAGVITPNLTREQARQLLQAAKADPVALPVASVSPPQFRRVAGLPLLSAQADKLEAIAAARGMTPTQLLTDVAEAWLKRQPMPEGTVIIDTTATAQLDS